MTQGLLVPDEMVCSIVTGRLSQEDCQLGFILDGFPRTLGQAQYMDDHDILVDRVFYLSVGDEVIVTRLSGRRVHPGSGRVYHLDYQPPKVEGLDDVTGESLIQRDDDCPDTILSRLDVYRTQTQPLIHFYQEKGLLVDLDGARDILEIEKEIVSMMRA